MGGCTVRQARSPATYSDAAIQACLTLKVVFGMALRQTTGFVTSLLRLANLDWPVPDFSTLSRRQKDLAVSISCQKSSEPLHLLIDSTGIKVEGDGEWHARKHGPSKRRQWRKLHIAVNEETLEIRAVEITGAGVGDAPMLPELLSQIPSDQDIATVTADGAYDTRKCHDAIAKYGAAAIIPPRKNAKPWKPEATLAPDFDDLEPRLTRQGYSVKALADQFHAKPAEIRRFLNGQLDSTRTRELADQMRMAGLAV